MNTQEEKMIKTSRIIVSAFICLAFGFFIGGMIKTKNLNYGVKQITVNVTDKTSYARGENEELEYFVRFDLYIGTQSPKGLREVVFKLEVYGGVYYSNYYYDKLYEENYYLKDVDIALNEGRTAWTEISQKEPNRQMTELFETEYGDLNFKITIIKAVFGDGKTIKY